MLIIFCNREISLVLHWAASLVGYMGSMTTGGVFNALFLLMMVSGRDYSYYAPPLPLYGFA